MQSKDNIKQNGGAANLKGFPRLSKIQKHIKI